MNPLYIILIVFLFLFIVWICTQIIGPPDWTPPFHEPSNKKFTGPSSRIPEIYVIYDVPN